MKILRILLTLTMATLISAVIGSLLGVNPLWIAGALALFSLAPQPTGVLKIALFDLARPTGSNPGAGGGLDSEIILINSEDIDWSTFPARGADGVTLSADIPLKAGKYMHRFYMTPDVIEPYFKKIKGGNKDSGGYEVGVKGFYPGMELAVLKWIQNFGYQFDGIVIIQNCANNTKYYIGEPCNLVYCDNIESVWGSTVDKEKGNNFTFMSKQKNSLGIYSGAITYDPGSASW